MSAVVIEYIISDPVKTTEMGHEKALFFNASAVINTEKRTGKKMIASKTASLFGTP
jgi:hypothetical protein